MPWNDRVRRRFKLRDLDILIEVAAAGSMGKAATRLNTAQPAVLKAVADLDTCWVCGSSTAPNRASLPPLMASPSYSGGR